MDSEWSPLELDRRLARAFTQWRGWRRRLRDAGGDPDDPPLEPFRDVAGRTAFRKLGELPENDPMRAPLRRWVYRLAEQRINHGVLVRLATERQRERQSASFPVRSKPSFEGLLERALGDAPRREPWARAVLEQAAPVSAISVELWQRRREIARRMGLDGPHPIEAPVANAAEIANRLGSFTAERIREWRTTSLAGFIERALGSDVPGEWPARLSPARLEDYFRDGALLRALELRPAPLPPSLGAASLCRALGVLGAAWLEALAPRDQPFAVAHDPYGLSRHGAAALFAQLPLNPQFLQRHLGVSRYASVDVVRRLAQIGLLELAALAFRVALRPAALESERAFREHFAELGQRMLNLSLPAAAAGAIFTLGIEDEQRLLGHLLAAERARQLTEAHDEDWFRNPRAIDQLRSEAALPPRTEIEPEVARAALDGVERTLGRWLG